MIALYIVLGLAALSIALFGLWLLCLLSMRKSPDMAKFEHAVFAHRGLHGKGVPENSIEAFRRAADAGYGMEFDLHLTSDGRLAVMHDDDTERMCGKKLSVHSSSYEELSALRLPDGSRIPLFEEVLSVVGGRVPLLIELKSDGGNADALCAKALDLLRGYDGPFLIESFDPRILARVKKADPKILRGQLSSDFVHSKTGPKGLRLLLSSMLTNYRVRPDFVAYDVRFRRALPVRILMASHKKIFFWTVRSEEEKQFCRDGGYTPIFEEI